MKFHSKWLNMHWRQLASKNNAKVDVMLRLNENSVSFKDQAILRIDVNQLAANKPVEDNFSASKCLSSDAHLFGVFDGHGGPACSRHVSVRLFDYLCAAVLDKHLIKDLPLKERLQWLFSSSNEKLIFSNSLHDENVRKFFKKFKTNQELVTMRKAIQAAFLALDEDLSNGAMPDNKGKVSGIGVNIVSSGTCALVAHIRLNNLHVANVGDSEAVLGVNHPTGIISRQLSRPHSTENVDEINRIRNGHPAKENSTILQAGRLLGELYPLRAFGDVRYKWSAQLQKIVLNPMGLATPQNLYTPPYLTALPEVLYHQLTPNDKFLVLATDGLWEWLDPDTVIRLINDHSLGAQTLSSFVPKQNQTLGEIFEDLKRRKSGNVNQPMDSNSATHVIRNALGGVSGGTDTQYTRLQKTLRLPPGKARHFRDDITVIVIHFNKDFLNQMQCN